ncbi:MAG: hypothetical protein HZA46_13870, partial [Planctomycetales bacterium]|nr:hypothetical protein [Planctomycetales bacterium]
MKSTESRQVNPFVCYFMGTVTTSAIAWPLAYLFGGQEAGGAVLGLLCFLPWGLLLMGFMGVQMLRSFQNLGQGAGCLL